jgi:hypothetical protein
LEKKSGANPYAMVHTLRHSFAKHLPEQRNMQGVPGYASVKTTEICSTTCPAVFVIIRKGGDQIQSPLDHLDLGDKRNEVMGGNGKDLVEHGKNRTHKWQICFCPIHKPTLKKSNEQFLSTIGQINGEKTKKIYLQLILKKFIVIF